MELWSYALVGIAAGFLGAMVGLGGGVLIVPALSLYFNVPIHEAIAASIVAVVATSTTASVVYLRHNLTNVKLGLTLETLTSAGAVLGGFTALLLSKNALSGIFAVALFLVSGYILYKERRKRVLILTTTQAGIGTLGANYYDTNLRRVVEYRVKRLPVGLAASFLAGNLSGLLGIGGGPIKVPAMTVGMGIPMKAAAATSSYMIGITAAASALIYYVHGAINPTITAPVALGVTAGAIAGTWASSIISSRALTLVFAVVLLWLSIQMGLSVLGIGF